MYIEIERSKIYINGNNDLFGGRIRGVFKIILLFLLFLKCVMFL